ncbi:lantibiotic dehydratase [Rugosimonospora africana]|uniref:Lantibiotic dehydratase N-terminal domain-containing protein n=1 Tax=Rugosimonospora africana TaxID=556532 RepID=A0A8J3R3G8_9ACTN|nr:lantibiotic dehydratase [Rugosimonospora africana]GIH21023.1 hypothetical protein Raf01_91950 [Rugosimonospora africana]
MSVSAIEHAVTGPQPGPDPTPGDGPATIEVAPYALVRVSALPFPQPAAAAERYRDLMHAAIDCERALTRTAQRLSDELYASRADHSGEYHRTVVLPLRRDVHNRRSPNATVRAGLGELPTRIPQLANWLSIVDQRERLLADLTAQTGPALAADREALAAVCSDERVRRAVALSSASLLSGLQRAAAAGGESDAKTRKAEPKILRHALRVTTKVSPWSWFTTVGWGRWTPAAAGSPDELRGTAVSLPNHVLVTMLLRGVLAMPEYRRGIPHRLAPALTVGDLRVEFQRDESVAVVGFMQVRAQLVRLPRTAALDAVVAELRDAGPAGRTIDQLAAMLAGRLPAGSSRAGAAAAYLGRLADEQLLVPIAPVDPQAADPLPALADWLAGRGGSELARELRTIAEQSRQFAELPATERVPVLDRLADQWRDAFAVTRTERPPDAAVLREDVVCRDRLLLGVSAGSNSRPDLAKVSALAEVFDNAAVMRALLRQRLVQQSGPGGSAPVAEVIGDGEWLWAAGNGIDSDGTVVEMPDGAPPLPPDLVDLARLRREVVAAVRRAPRHGDELELTDDLIDEAVATAPRWLSRRPSSRAYFVQPFQDAEGIGWCLNGVGDGWGRYTSRFLAALGPQLAAAVGRQLREALRDGRPVQYRPTYGFNANLHPRLLADEVGEDPAWANLLATELELVHHQESDTVRLRVIGTGELLNVLYLGFLFPGWLPDRVAPLYLDLGGSLTHFSHLPPAEPVEVRGRTVKRYARLRYRSLVLSRRAWRLDPQSVQDLISDLRHDGDVPARGAVRWAATLGLPPAVFVSSYFARLGNHAAMRAALTDPKPQLVDVPKRQRAADPKPQFVDLASALHLRCLARLLAEHSGPVLIEEALPVPGEAPTGRHATELVVETYLRRG